MRLRPFLLLAGLVALPVAALANGPGLPDTFAPALRPGNGTEIGLQTNFGMLDAVDGTNFTWICHETLVQPGATITPTYWMGGGTTFLASVKSLAAGAVVTTNSLFYSPDGCDWTPTGGTRGSVVRDVAIDPSNPSHVLAVSANFHLAGVPPSAVLASTDGGQSFTPTALQNTAQFFTYIRFSPDVPGLVWAVSSYYSPVSAYVYRSTDGGVSFSQYPWTFSIGGVLQTSIDVAALRPGSSREAWLHVTKPGEDVLLYTSDGGASFRPLLTTTGGIVIAPNSIGVGGATFDAAGTLWIPGADGGSWRSTDGINFQHIPGPPPSVRGFAADGRGVFAAANAYVDFGLGITTDQGVSWRSLFTYPQLKGPRSCPASSLVTTVCDPLYPSLELRLGITPTPSPTPNSAGGGGCSCDLGSDAPGAGIVLVGCYLIALLARRASQKPTETPSDPKR